MTEKAEITTNLAWLNSTLTQRSSIKGQITKFKNYLDKGANKSHLSNIEVTEFNLKLTKFESLAARFNDLQSEVEILNYDVLDEENEIRESIKHEIIISIATEKVI